MKKYKINLTDLANLTSSTDESILFDYVSTRKNNYWNEITNLKISNNCFIVEFIFANLIVIIFHANIN